MDKSDFTPIFIISAEREIYAQKHNSVLTAELVEIIEESGVQHKPVISFYEGFRGKSFILNTDRQKALAWARLFDQRSVLYVDARRRAWLLYLEYFGQPETRVFQGQFQSCSEAEAKAGDAWTYDPLTKCHYHIVPPKVPG